MKEHGQLETLYREYAPALFRFLIRLTGNEAETKDVLQEIFMRLARDGGPPADLTSPRSYLFRLAHRLAIDRHRRETTRNHYHERAGHEPAAVEAIPPANDDVAWLQSTLRTVLATLPAEQKAVVLLKIWEELTFAEIAGVLGISINTASSRYRYALNKMQSELRPHYKELP